MLLKDKWNEQDDEEEDVSSYFMTVRKSEGTGILKRNHRIAVCGQFNFQQAVDLSQDKLRNEEGGILWNYRSCIADRSIGTSWLLRKDKVVLRIAAILAHKNRRITHSPNHKARALNTRTADKLHATSTTPQTALPQLHHRTSQDGECRSKSPDGLSCSVSGEGAFHGG